MNDLTALASNIRERKTLLFVGAGVSMNLGLPSFSVLIDKLAEDLGYAPEIFSTHGDYLALTEYYHLKKRSIGPLRSWMDKRWHEGINISESGIHTLLTELDFPLIYTTNYDSWLERAYEEHGKPYQKVTKVEDLAAHRADTTQIVKFHGDFDDDQSLVLTESQYFERLAFESPLDIKLRADLLAHSVLFLGYSLSDINLRYMLFKLQRLWRETAPSASRPPSYMFLTRPNPVQEEVLRSRGVQTIVADDHDPKVGVTNFLETLLKEVRSVSSL